jgi:hypothetical protein
LAAWRSLLDSRLGKAWWQAFAAVLPPLIPVSAFLQKGSTDTERGVTLAVLLLAIALVQLYGRAGEQRERTKTATEREQQQVAAETRFADLFSEIREGRREAEEERREASEGITEQTALLIDLFSEIREGRREVAEGIAKQGDLLIDLVAEIRSLGGRNRA